MPDMYIIEHIKYWPMSPPTVIEKEDHYPRVSLMTMIAEEGTRQKYTDKIIRRSDASKA